LFFFYLIFVCCFFKAWKTLNDKKVRLTTRHYETYLSGLNENGFIFDADYYLKLIDSEQIQATPRLYSLLLTQYVFIENKIELFIYFYQQILS